VVNSNDYSVFTEGLSAESDQNSSKLGENEIRAVNRRTARRDLTNGYIKVYKYNQNGESTQVERDEATSSYKLLANTVYYVDLRIDPAVCTMPEITIMGILYRNNSSQNVVAVKNIQLIPMNMFNLD
jgi:hypothetical protein